MATIKGKRKRQDLQAEVWRPITGCVGCEVSTRSRVRTRRSINGRGPLKDEWRILKPILNGGYQKYNLPGRRGARVAVLMLEAFVGPRPKGLVARHLNDIPADDRLDNLAWGTHKQNKEDAIRNGRQPVRERHGMAKLTWPQVREIRRRRVEENASAYAMAKEHGMTTVNIMSILRYDTWKE